MNNQRRKRLKIQSNKLKKIIDNLKKENEIIEEMYEEILAISIEEEESFNMLPESFQVSDRGAEMEDNANQLLNTYSELQDVHYEQEELIFKLKILMTNLEVLIL